MTTYKKGIRRTSVMVNVPAAVSTLIHPIPAGRSAVIRKIMWLETAGVAGNLMIGHNLAFVQDLPAINAPANLAGTMEEDEIPNREFVPSPAGLTTQDIYALTTAGTTVAVQLEIEEYGA